MNLPHGQYGQYGSSQPTRRYPKPHRENLRELTLDRGFVYDPGGGELFRTEWEWIPRDVSATDSEDANWPAYGAYGEASTMDTLLQAIPGVGAFLEKVSDPIREAQTLQVKLADAKRRGASLTEIQEIEGKLAAAQHRVNLQLSREQSSSQWSNIGKVAAVGGIVLIGSLIVLVGVKAVKAGGKK